MNARRALTLIAACLTFAAVDHAHADELSLGLHVASVHVPQHEQNNTNPGLYIRYDQWQVGGYENSLGRTTVYGGYAVPVGPIEVMLGLATGYQRICKEYDVYVPTERNVEHLPGGSSVTTTTYAHTDIYEDCKGFSKYAVTPLVALSYTAPFTVMGAQPQILFMPGFGKHSSVAHLAFKWSIK